ncbi:hypothetical protein CHY_1466 [Carboxydothermus hydrogenoformans Z-2901]|uniref:Uncharacterized protein n=1 Tax=Carboxydothermus hydrogenoformans (strain ATCC BAA-161 / DSM 6008 / Z-2901) TaxID=246194 RepID=Q3AC36_CARHZ|nr:hypothetical protein CHY_1466 [Carboxydothermus hydrogenoformans Z-2901]
MKISFYSAPKLYNKKTKILSVFLFVKLVIIKKNYGRKQK